MMEYTSCPDSPHVVRRTYDGGNNTTYTYDLCENCKNYSVFQKNILKTEKIKNEFAATLDSPATLGDKPNLRENLIV